MRLPEAAADSRAHLQHATHVYTNADIDRLQGASWQLGFRGADGIVDMAHEQAGEADRGDSSALRPGAALGGECPSTLASGAGEVDEAMLDVGANQLDAQFISDVEALSALRQ